MAIAANAVWELRTTATASNVNGGFFVTGASGNDYSQQDAAQYALTGVSSAGAGNTILTASAAADMVGNGIRTVSGTNFTLNSWFEITSVVVGVSITCSTNRAGASISTGVGSSGVMNIGGAISFNSTLDDDLFENFSAGNIVYIKSGTYTQGETISVATGIGTFTEPIEIIGYNSSRGDNPSIDNRPTIAMGASTITLGAYTNIKFVNFTTTAAGGFTMGTGTILCFCSFVNTSTTAARDALIGGSEGRVIGCNLVSQNGEAITAALGFLIYGNYIHDSLTGIFLGSGANTMRPCIISNIISSCRSIGISNTATTLGNMMIGNTIYGYETPSATGILLAVNSLNNILINNIVYGWTTGISQTTTQAKSNNGIYNNFFNNTTNATNYTLDASDLTLTPSFTSASQLTGSTATTSGSVLTQTGGDFSSVTDNKDYLHVFSGTGVTVGIYLITSHTADTVTVNNALGTSSAGDVVWAVTTNKNFAVGTNMKAAGYPGLFHDAESTGYLDIGAVQRQEPASGGGTPNVGRGFLRGVI